MRARLTSRILGFRSLFSIVVLAFGAWLAVMMQQEGYARAGVWLPVFTVAFVVLLNSLSRLPVKSRYIKGFMGVVVGVLAGLMLIGYPATAFSLAFPKLAGDVVVDTIYGGLLVLYAIGIWFSSVWRHWDARLEHGLTMLACNMAKDCISLPDDMSETTVDATCGNIAYMLVEQWQFILFVASALLGITLVIMMSLTESIFWIGVLIAFASQTAWLARCMDRVESAVCQAKFSLA